MKYKFEIIGADGNRLPLKADPYAFAQEFARIRHRVVSSVEHFQWTDGDYLKARVARDARRSPMSIYEVHLGSWRKKDGTGFLSYDELAIDLVDYVRDLGFTHIELLPSPSIPTTPVGLSAHRALCADFALWRPGRVCALCECGPCGWHWHYS